MSIFYPYLAAIYIELFETFLEVVYQVALYFLTWC